VLTTLLVGLLLLVAADVGFAYQTLRDTYTATSLVNLGWPFGFLLIGFAGLLSASWTLTYAAGADVDVPRPWRQALPASLLIPLVVVAVSTFRNDSLSTGIPLSVMTGLSVLALVLRSAISVGLVRDLEGAHSRLLLWIEDDVKRRRAA